MWRSAATHAVRASAPRPRPPICSGATSPASPHACRAAAKGQESVIRKAATGRAGGGKAASMARRPWRRISPPALPAAAGLQGNPLERTIPHARRSLSHPLAVMPRSTPSCGSPVAEGARRRGCQHRREDGNGRTAHDRTTSVRRGKIRANVVRDQMLSVQRGRLSFRAASAALPGRRRIAVRAIALVARRALARRRRHGNGFQRRGRPGLLGISRHHGAPVPTRYLALTGQCAGCGD